MEPTPEPETLYIHQGTIDSVTGEPKASTSRVYTVDIPITHQEFTILGLGDGYWFGGRFYDENDDYLVALVGEAASNTVYYKNADEHDGAWGVASSVTIHIGSDLLSSVKKMRLIIRTELGSDDITPSDVEDMEISVDGVTYKFTPAEVENTLDCYQGSLSGADGTPTVNATRVYTAEVPITNQEFHVTGFGNGYWFGGRFYDENSDFVVGLSDSAYSSNVYFKNAGEHDGSWGTASDVTIHIGSDRLASVKKMRIIVRTQLGSDNLAPSDVENMAISVDGVSYTLQPGTI